MFAKQESKFERNTLILNGNGKTAGAGRGFPQAARIAAPLLTPQLESRRTRQRFDLPQGRGGKPNRPPLGRPLGNGKRNVFAPSTRTAFRRACPQPSPEPPSARPALRRLCRGAGPRRTATKSAAGGTATAPGGRAPPRRPLLRPLAGGSAGGSGRPPEERRSLRSVQVFEGKKKPRPGRPPEAGLHLWRGPAPQRSPAGFFPPPPPTRRLAPRLPRGSCRPGARAVSAEPRPSPLRLGGAPLPVGCPPGQGRAGRPPAPVSAAASGRGQGRCEPPGSRTILGG